MRRCAAFAMFILAWLAPAAAQQVTQGPALEPRQQPPLTFRATTNTVEVNAIVTDATGAFVRGLTREDFEVIEDGKPQNVTVAALVDIPVERVDPPLFRDKPIEPDVVSNEKPFEGRVFMIVLDSFHVASIRSTVVKTQARRFVERYIGANDLASVVHVGHSAAGQEFTSNRRLLLQSIDKFMGQALNSASFNIARDARYKQAVMSVGADAGGAGLPYDPGPPEDTEARERAFMARESADALKRLSEYMAGLNGRRKALLLFSEGIDFETMSPPVLMSADPLMPRKIDEGDSVRNSQRSMIAAATRANVSIYSLDPRGLGNSGDEMIALGAVAQADTQGVQPNGRDYSNPTLRTDMANEIRLQEESLRSFSDETGGLAFIASNDVDASFRRVLDDNSAYYLLGYTSPDARRDGRFHRVTVRVKRPGVTIRTRNGYYAPNEKESAKVAIDPVGNTLASPAPLTGLGMRATAGVVRTPEGKGRVHLTVEFSGRDIALRSQAGVFVNDLEIGYYALDMSGRSHASGRQFMHLRLKPTTREVFPANGVRYFTEFDLTPGRYQLRVAAREQEAGRSGSIFYDLDVPDFASAPLSMSDLLITSTAAERTITAKGAPSLGPKLPGQPTAMRTFSRTDTLSLFAGIYDTQTSRVHSVDFKVAVTADDGREVISRQDVRSSEELGGKAGEFPYTVSVPLQTLTPGRYVLSVEARSRLGGEAVRRDVEFWIK